MNAPLLTLEVRQEPDVILARQRARQIAGLLGFSQIDQTRVATATSEVARNAYQHAGGGRVEFLVSATPPGMLVRVRERGPAIRDLQAILHDQYPASPELGGGVSGARRLVDQCDFEPCGAGVTVTLVKSLPKRTAPFTSTDLARVSSELAHHAPQGLLEELQNQNQELLRTLEELRERQSELAQLHNRELEETNRGVVALYAELDESAKALRRISELKSRFLSNMSHEFRSPLNTIRSLSAFLLEGSSGQLNPEQEKEIGFIRSAAEILATLVNDLLDLAKVEAGKAVVRPVEFEVSELFESLRGTIRPLLGQGTVSLLIEEPVGILPLQTDEGKLAQVLRNFLSNAVKYTEQGEIRLSAAVGPGDTVILSVTDTGIGIAPEDQQRIFEEFSQIEGPLQKRVKGTGLGLPLSRKLAELLGGTVSVRSAPGIGSTFYAVIPRVYRDPETDENGSEPGWRLDPNRAPVLLVEDDPVNLFLYEKYLEGSGFQALPARTLDAARRILRRIKPVAVVLDIMLGAESGWTLLQELKGTDATKDLPVFVLTVVDGQERALSLGADQFCLKPIERDWLLAKLGALQKHGPVERILIIDDHESDRHILKRLLLPHGAYNIIEARSGEEGLRLALQGIPDVIFLDLDMPDLNGFEVLERLKAGDATKDIPVIINTSAALDDEKRKRLTEGAAAILLKSSGTREELFARIHEALIQAGLGQSGRPEA